MTATAPRPKRADAQRNYDSLLDAAREAFAEHGTDAPFDDIAKRAGVGSGTLYRHFPTRTALLEAVLEDKVVVLADRGRTLLGHPDPGSAMEIWLRALISYAMTYPGLAGALMLLLHRGKAQDTTSCHTVLFGVAEALLDRARNTGSLRADIGLADVLKLANGVALASEQQTGDPALADRLLAVVMAGLGLSARRA